MAERHAVLGRKCPQNLMVLPRQAQRGKDLVAILHQNSLKQIN
jgi:hypothetical protein